MRKKYLARLASAVALCTLAPSVAAQISEADRLKRCQNNREMIRGAQIGLSWDGYMSEEQIARFRTAMVSARGEMAHYRRVREEAYRTTIREQGLTDYYLEQANDARTRAVEIGREMGVICGTNPPGVDVETCQNTIPEILGRAIDRAVAARPAAAANLADIERYRRNLLALNCDQARAPGVADIAGAWRGADGTVYSITQSGDRFSWTRSGTDEQASGTISGSSMSAQWASSQGSGGGSASIQLGPNGVPVQIRWSNGNVFTR